MNDSFEARIKALQDTHAAELKRQKEDMRAQNERNDQERRD